MCRQQLLEAQDQLLIIMKKMMLLNPRAQVLRKKREKAEKRLKWAIGTANPKLIAAAKSYLAFVILQQINHGIKQQKWILQARRVQSLASHKFSDLLRKEFKGALVNLTPPKYKWSMVPNPLFSLTPDYLPSIFFEHRQKAWAQWDIDFKKILPPWLSSLLKTNTLLHFQCATTISKKKKTPEHPILRPLKSNLFFNLRKNRPFVIRHFFPYPSSLSPLHLWHDLHNTCIIHELKNT